MNRAHRPVMFLWLAFLCCGIASAQDRPPRPLVWVLSTGGTIAGKGDASTNLSAYKSGVVSGEDLIRAVPEIAQVADVHVEQIANVSSADITPETWLTLAKRIAAIFADPRVSGIVVTHGTNTLEETAYFLNLTVRDQRPVVVVGAMRPSTAISADGPLNLLNAVRTATAPEARGKGVLVVMNDQIDGARDVTKTNTYRVQTFRAPELGALGEVDDDKVSFYRASTRRHTAASEFDVTRLQSLPKVAILYTYAGVDLRPLLQAAIASGVEGVVFAGTGAGSLSTVDRKAVQEIATGKILIVRSSRVGSGRVVRSDALDALGTIPADSLNPQKARVLLMLALTQTHNSSDVRRMFEEY